MYIHTRRRSAVASALLSEEPALALLLPKFQLLEPALLEMIPLFPADDMIADIQFDRLSILRCVWKVVMILRLNRVLRLVLMLKCHGVEKFVEV